MHTPPRTASSRRSAGSNRSSHRSLGSRSSNDRGTTTRRSSHVSSRRAETPPAGSPRQHTQQRVLPPPRTPRPRPPLRPPNSSTMLTITFSPSVDVRSVLDSVADKLNYCTNTLLSAQNALQTLRSSSRDDPTLPISTHADPRRPAVVNTVAAEPDSVIKVSCTCAACEQRGVELAASTLDIGTSRQDSTPIVNRLAAAVADENADSLSPNNQPSSTVTALESPTPLSSAINTRQQYDCSTCIICLDRVRKTLLLPCRHLYSCDQCYRRQHATRCSICYARVDSTIQVYLA